jgi:hypothetical protein
MYLSSLEELALFMAEAAAIDCFLFEAKDRN